MFGWLVTQIRNLSIQECRGRGALTSNSFCAGAVKGIEGVFKHARAEATDAVRRSGQESALVRLRTREQEAQEYMNRVYGLVPPTPKPTVDAAAYNQGNRLGAQVGLRSAPKLEARPERGSAKLGSGSVVGLLTSEVH